MKKIISYISIGFILSASLTFAAAANCGDGNHFYRLLDQGETIFYAGNSEDFIVIKQSENKITIEDKVKCRFGKDSLLEIKNIKFLDKTISVQDLIIESAQSQLTESLLSRFISEHLQALFGASDKKTHEESNNSEARVVEADTQATFGSGFGVSGNTGVNSQGTSPIFTTTSFGIGNTNTSFSNTASFDNTNPIFSQPTNQNLFFQPSTQVNSGFNNPFDLFGSQSTQQFNQSQTASAVVAWDPLSVGSGQSVYFEANDVNNRHYFLGSAAGFVGSAQVTIPANFAGQEQVTVFIKSGTRLIGTYVISLR